MELFEANQAYTSKEVQKKMKISRTTLNKYTNSGLGYTNLPGTKARRFIGSVLNSYFGLSKE